MHQSGMVWQPSGIGRRKIRRSLAWEKDMECTVRWHTGMSFVAETGSGHMVAMDGAPEAGGANLAPRPMELLLAGAGGCTAFDVVLILKRGHQAVSGCEVKIGAQRAEADPKVFTRLDFHYVVTGKALKPEAVERAVKLSAEKYCSASIMLGKTAEMHHTWEIVEG
jgi:putative redox protein